MPFANIMAFSSVSRLMLLTESLIIILKTLYYYFSALSFGRFGWFGGGWCAAPFGFSLSAATSPMPLSVFFLSSRRPFSSCLQMVHPRPGRSCSVGSSRSIPPTLVKPSTHLELTSPKNNSALHRISGWNDPAVVGENRRHGVRARRATV